MSDQKRINGNIVSWGSIKATLDNDRYAGFVSISYADKLETVMVYGMGKAHAPRAQTRGKYSCEPVKLKGPKSTVEALRQALASRSESGTSYGQHSFPVVVQYLETGDTSMLVELMECRYVGTSSSEEESADPLMEEIELTCKYIVRNGVTLFEPDPDDVM
jgi:hypothetical protein